MPRRRSRDGGRIRGLGHNEFDWLQVTSIGGANAAPPSAGSLPPTWGLHLGDVNLALGNLVDLARRQAAAYRR